MISIAQLRSQRKFEKLILLFIVWNRVLFFLSNSVSTKCHLHFEWWCHIAFRNSTFGNTNAKCAPIAQSIEFKSCLNKQRKLKNRNELHGLLRFAFLL